MKILKPKELQTQAQIAIVVSKFNEEVTEKLCAGSVQALQAHGVTDKQLTIVWVPGAVEIPLAAKRLAMTEKYAGIIALGAVIQGESDHHIYVNEFVTHGCLKVSLKHNVPVLFGVLTTHNEDQALARSNNDCNKGHDVAIALLELLSTFNQME